MATKTLDKIELLEKDFEEVKKTLPQEPKLVSIKGLLKDIEITEKDITEGKKSLFNSA